MADSKLYKLIDRLAESLPLSVEAVSEILGVELKEDPESSGPMFTAFAHAGNGAYKSVEMRVSLPDFGQTDGLLTIYPADTGGIDRKQILEHYGLECETSVPSPRYPAGLPASIGYKRPWGNLTFGVTNDDASQLVRFVMTTKDESDLTLP